MNDIINETSIRIASKEDAKSINDISKNELVNLLWQKLKNGQNLKHKINSSKFWGRENTSPQLLQKHWFF